MKKKFPYNPVIFFGLWTIPFTLAVAIILRYNWTHVITLTDCLRAILAAIIGCLLVTGIHVYQYLAWGKREFTLRSAFHNSDLPSSAKRHAQHPTVPPQYLSTEPRGYILGTEGHQYVRIDPMKDSFCGLICSSPGAGKSVTMTASLIGNYAHAGRRFTTIATDPKGELSERFKDLPDVFVVSLTDRNQYGYNPLYWYTPEMTDEEMEQYLKAMSSALVSDSGGEKNQYFWANARKILIGLMAWLIRKGKNFPQCMTAITTHNVMSLIDQALEESDSKLVKKSLATYAGKSGEDMESITTELTTSLDIFAGSASMEWALGESCRMASPKDLDTDNSIFLSIEQERIQEFSPFIRLFYTQMFQHLIKTRNGAAVDRHLPVWILLDECPLYGAIPELDAFLSTCRSRKVSVYIVCQSLSQLEGTYGKEKAKTLLDDCLVKLVLGIADNDTAEYFSKMCGQYEEPRTSIHTKEIFSIPDSYNDSHERRRILEPEEFFQLKQTDSAVVIVDGQFLKIRKSQYFKDPKMLALLEENERILNEIQEGRGSNDDRR